MNFNELMELDCYTYRVLLRDAFVHLMSQSPDGREYLESAWILSQTSPDRQQLRDKFQK